MTATAPVTAGTRPSAGFQGVLATLRPLAIFACVALAVLLASRLGLAWLYADRLAAAGGLPRILLMGLRFDLIIVAYICIVPLLISTLAPGFILRSRAWQSLLVAWFCVWIMLLVFNEAATPAFIAEFGVRPNRQYVEYLDTPGLVLSTIWNNNRVSLIVGILLTVVAGVTKLRLLRRRATVDVHPAWARALVLLPLLVVLGYTARGSVGHRPLSVSNAALSSDPTVNDLALNSTYSVAYAVRQLLEEQDTLRGYASLDSADVVSRVRDGMQLPAAGFNDAERPTRHVLVPTANLQHKPNLVILLQESLGAQYFASLGGQPVAQQLEKWRPRSFWFDQLYATGTRSARGIEAVVTGFLPSRTSSVIKLEGAQKNFFTLARALKDQGYRTEFIYGGDASFDNMRRFFLNNGFDRVIDQSDLAPTATFTTTWGVSDEDLYARVHQEVSAHDRAGDPFFALVFSTSNHPPYDFPEGRIKLYEEPKLTHRNAARYADFAAAAYLDRAARSPYWANTVFSVIADHESKSVGEQLVPIFSFHIPAFITGGPVKPRIISRLASQVDLLPTTLSLMGLAVPLPATGIDQSRTDLTGPGEAVMQFNDNAAYRVGDKVAILMAHQPIRQFRIAGNALLPVPGDPDFARDALAQTLMPVLAYQDNWYR